jgi:oligoribonuclease NrnB/cAMP/cGMP phosphodiesterase (DHH superfamily)
MDAIISHADADGVISASFLLKLKPKSYLYFSSSTFLHKTICKLLDFDIENLYILDISANRKTILLSSIFKKIIWIDHHQWENLEIPNNVEVFVEEAESAAKVVAKVLKIEDPLVDIANEIDTNNIKNDSAKFFRDLISAIKWKYGKTQSLKFRQIAKILAFRSLDELEKDAENVKLIEEHSNWLQSIVPEILEKAKEFEVNGKKIVIFETTKSLPVYFVYDSLKKSKSFDLLCVFYRKVDMRRKIPVTKIEIRSNNEDALKIARIFDGGGHKLASGATINRYLSIEEFLDRIKQVI